METNSLWYCPGCDIACPTGKYDMKHCPPDGGGCGAFMGLRPKEEVPDSATVVE